MTTLCWKWPSSSPANPTSPTSSPCPTQVYQVAFNFRASCPPSWVLPHDWPSPWKCKICLFSVFFFLNCFSILHPKLKINHSFIHAYKMVPARVSPRWTNYCAKGRRRRPMSQPGRATLRRGRSQPTDGYGFTVKHSADSLFGVLWSMATEVADLLHLPSSYRRPDGTWPSFSYYSAL